jgi:hypothetical protein
VIDIATITAPIGMVAPPPTIALTVEQQVHVASTFLEDNSWVLQVGGAFVIGEYFITESTDICNHEAGVLYKIMNGRFSSLLNSRLLDQQMHNHECIIFVQWNLVCMAATLILLRQVKDDLMMTSEDGTLLHDPENVFIRAIGEAAEYQGNYLYYDIQ